MRALKAARSPKAVSQAAKPKRGEKMPLAAFPLSKSRSYRLGRSWEWSTYELTGDDGGYRLLVAVDEAKQQALAWLAHDDGDDLAVVARLEYHPTHRGWHCHWRRGELDELTRGVVKESRLHEGVRVCVPDKEREGSVTHTDALGIAFRIFNIRQSAGGMFQ